MDNEPGIICLTEHWLKPDEEAFMKINGYTMISSYSRRTVQHGGACVYVLEHIKSMKLGFIEEMSIEGHIDCSCILLPSEKCIVLSVYRTGLGQLSTFLDKLDEILNILTKKYSKHRIICCGDFNINLLDNSHTKNVFIDTMSSYNMTHLINDELESQTLLKH
nr:unnamed protein product [Callosobruchus analis]